MKNLLNEFFGVCKRFLRALKTVPIKPILLSGQVKYKVCDSKQANLMIAKYFKMARDNRVSSETEDVGDGLILTIKVIPNQFTSPSTPGQ